MQAAAAQHAVASSGLLALHPRGAVKTESLRPKSAYDGGRSNKVRKVEALKIDIKSIYSQVNIFKPFVLQRLLGDMKQLFLG